VKSLKINDGKGFWARDGNRVINVRTVLPGPVLSEIYIFEIGDQANLEAMGRAQTGRFTDNEWIIEGFSRSVIQPERVTVERIPRASGVGTVITPDMLQVLSADPNNLAIRDLIYYVDYLRANGLDTRSYELALWLKVLSPFTNMALLFVAMPFVFGSHRSASTGQRIVIGIFLGLLFFLMNRMLGNLVMLYGYHPIIGASFPTLAFFAGGALALKRMR
jgi:lipopolysaccharide export system permease protein